MMLGQNQTHNLGKNLTYKMVKLGQNLASEPTCIYIYIYAVKLKTGPRFGGFKVKNWSKFKVKNWSKFFFHCFSPYFIVFFGYF